MFERYTEPARRSIFFARYEASNFGSQEIEPHHLLLGILRENGLLKSRVLGNTTLDALRAEFAHFVTGLKVPTSVDLPLSAAGKHALAYAAEEANTAGNAVIEPEHLLAGLLRERTPASEALEKRGITLEVVREELSHKPSAEATPNLYELFRAIPRERAAAALRILAALASPQVTVSVTTAADQFTISFPSTAQAAPKSPTEE